MTIRFLVWNWFGLRKDSGERAILLLKLTERLSMCLPQLKPSDPAEYSASVIRSADPRPGGNGLMVCLDIPLTRISISTDSYDALELETPLVPGDACTVRISWREMCDAALQGKTPTGEIVAVLKQQSSPTKNESVTNEEPSSREKVSPSSDKSSDSKEQNSENEVVSDGELSCEEGRGARSRRDRNAEIEPRRRRHRSVGDNPLYDAPGMPFPYTSQSHMYPYMPYPGYMHPDEMQYHLWMQSQKYHPQSDAAQRFPTMNTSHEQQCHTAMNAAQYQHTTMSSTHLLPPSYEATGRQPRVRMTLREYLDRGGRVRFD